MSLFHILYNRPKDALLSATVRPLIQTRITPCGTMTHFNIDSVSKSIDITLDLKGEPAPITIHLGNYEFVEQNGKTCLRIDRIETSREWINTLVRDCLPKERRTFPLPRSVAGVVSMLL